MAPKKTPNVNGKDFIFKEKFGFFLEKKKFFFPKNHDSRIYWIVDPEARSRNEGSLLLLLLSPPPLPPLPPSYVFPVGHGSEDGTVTSDLECAVMPGQHQSVVFVLRRCEEAVNVFHQNVHRFLVQSLNRFVDVLLA